ncbi:MAG: cache domain-containing protein, partial [Desulfobacterota bacterium]|nr:cache domain-containing protein [Thermodesulfobacteriota bacterium]
MPSLRLTLTLRDKFILSFLLIVGFTGIAAGLTGHYLINKLVKEEVQERVRAALFASQGIYEQELSNIGIKIQLIAERLFLKKNLSYGKLSPVFQELDKFFQQEKLDILFLTDEKGKVLYRAHNPEEKGDDFSRNFLIQSALNQKIIQTTFVIPADQIFKEGKEVIRKVAFPVTDQSRLTVKNADALVVGKVAPILTDEGKIIGTLMGGVILNSNFQLVDKIKGFIFPKTTSKEHQLEVITFTLRDLRIATTYQDEKGNRLIGTRLSPEVTKKVIIDGEIYLEKAMVVSHEFLTGYYPLKDYEGKVLGSLGVGICEHGFFYRRDEVLMAFLCFILLAMILAFTLSYFLARHITRPVKILAREATKIGRGEFVQIKPPSRDEIGSFAETFNQMSKSIQEREEKLKAQTGELLRIKEELENTNLVLSNQSKELKRSVKELSVLFEASRKISSSLNLSEIIEAVLDLLMQEFKTDIWSILLLDNDGYLRIKGYRGLIPDFVVSIVFQPTRESYSGECFLAKQIMLIKDADKATKPIFPKLEIKEEGIKSFGLVPISIGEKALGVLICVSKEKKGFFTEEYSEFMKTIGQQLAIAINNIRQYERIKNFSQELEQEVIKRTEELKEKSDLLMEAEKLAALGEMADRVAHETRNPITVIGGFARRLKRALATNHPLSSYADIIIKEVERLELMIFWITEFKKYISTDFELSNINLVIEHALNKVQDMLNGTNIVI